ncbi:MAG: hypothetical protein R3F59_00280 [Myxococcota bacterium]
MPGTEAHTFWTAVRHQQRGTDDDLAAVDALLDRWRTRHGDTAMRQRIERRQQVLRCDRDLDGAPLADALGLRFDHPREAEDGAVPEHPTALDPGMLDPEAVLRVGLAVDRQLGGLTDAALPLLLARPALLDRHRRRALLQRLRRTGLPGLLEALVADRQGHRDEAFGDLTVHAELTAAELDALAEQIPAVREEPAWIEAQLRRLRPPEPVDRAMHAGLDDDALAAYLDAAWGLVAPLPAGYDRLKTHVLGHRLRVDERRDAVDPQRLCTYLELTPDAGYAPAERRRADRPPRRGSDGSAATALGDALDEPRVRTLVARCLEQGVPAETFAPYVDRGWLSTLIAETGLLGGAPPERADRYVEVLGPVRLAALRDRVDIELLPTNPPTLPADAPVHLDVALKHCWPLRLRVFRIATGATGGDVAVDVDLDGLVPGEEQVLEAPGRSALLRERRRLAVPGCEGPGTWVVELVGNGRASRAVVRKGGLYAQPRRTAGGLAVRIVDERGEPRPDAVLTLGERELRPRADGEIAVPFGTTDGGPRRVLLRDGELVVGADLQLPVERYALTASVLLDRQALVPGAVATALVRAGVTVDGAPVPLAVLDEPYVEVVTVDRLGVPVRRRRTVAWGEAGELEVAVPVPEHLVTLSIAVGGRVRVVSQHRTDDLRDEVQVTVGGIHGTDEIEAAFLEQGADGAALRLLGKSGEPRPGRSLALALGHALLTRPLHTVLATDSGGVAALGALPGVEHVTVGAPGPGQAFALHPPEPALEAQVLRADAPFALRVPHTTGWQLVELRGGAPAHDRSDRATLDAGLLRGTLPAGLYALRTDAGTVELRVVAEQRGWARVADAQWRLAPLPTGIASAAIEGDAVVVRLANASRATRLHAVATRFAPAPAFGADLAGPRPRAEAFDAPLRRTSVVSGRDIGDEARYVLDRRRLPHRPGNLLDKPSLLLVPYALRETQTRVQASALGGAWGAADAAPGYGGGGVRASRPSSAAAPVADADFAAYDFLAQGPVVLAGLRPDGDGVVRVPLASLAGAETLRLVCVDPSGTDVRDVGLAAAPLAVRDLRLAEALPDRPLREVRSCAPWTRRPPSRTTPSASPRSSRCTARCAPCRATPTSPPGRSSAAGSGAVAGGEARPARRARLPRAVAVRPPARSAAVRRGRPPVPGEQAPPDVRGPVAPRPGPDAVPRARGPAAPQRGGARAAGPRPRRRPARRRGRARARRRGRRPPAGGAPAGARPRRSAGRDAAGGRCALGAARAGPAGGTHGPAAAGPRRPRAREEGEGRPRAQGRDARRREVGLRGRGRRRRGRVRQLRRDHAPRSRRPPRAAGAVPRRRPDARVGRAQLVAPRAERPGPRARRRLAAVARSGAAPRRSVPVAAPRRRRRQLRGLRLRARVHRPAVRRGGGAGAAGRADPGADGR